MTPEERDLLHRAVELAEENNTILKKMHRTARLSLVMRGIYWAIIIFLSFGAYYFIQPYINQMIPLLNVASGGDVSTFENLRGLIGK